MVDLRVLSLGAGVQSTTLALMIKKGEIPMVDCGIFADTMAEPLNVYTHLDWLKKQVSFPIHIIHFGNLYKDVMSGATDGVFLEIPAYTKDKITQKKGLLFRQCTNHYKIQPINKKVRELLGVGYKKRVPKNTKVEMLIGISTNEISRTRRNKLPYIENIYPLIDKNYSRNDCLKWMEKNNYPKPPRSACTFCPFHSNEEWKDIKKNKEEWDQVVALDKAIRHGTKKDREKNNKNEIFLHKSGVPLDEADLDPNKDQQDLFNDICDEGMCGV
jgi:3'-phosphoadenosine 5'-phosphosulfate sulfotransferase (PAPS reductase)/FAD synthetase